MMEYWRQCALWLINCKVLPANHRVTWESAQVFDLAQTLRDGVLLCHLLNNLRPQTINLKEINLRPQMSQVRNERLLLAAPRNNLAPLETRLPQNYLSLQSHSFFAERIYTLEHNLSLLEVKIAMFQVRHNTIHKFASVKIQLFQILVNARYRPHGSIQPTEVAENGANK